MSVNYQYNEREGFFFSHSPSLFPSKKKYVQLSSTGVTKPFFFHTSGTYLNIFFFDVLTYPPPNKKYDFPHRIPWEPAMKDEQEGEQKRGKK